MHISNLVSRAQFMKIGKILHQTATVSLSIDIIHIFLKLKTKCMSDSRIAYYLVFIGKSSTVRKPSTAAQSDLEWE